MALNFRRGRSTGLGGSTRQVHHKQTALKRRLITDGKCAIRRIEKQTRAGLFLLGLTQDRLRLDALKVLGTRPPYRVEKHNCER